MLNILVHHEIDIISQKQIMMMQYNAEVEDRRMRLIEFIQSSDELQLSRETRKNILENVYNMKMEVLRTTKVNKELSNNCARHIIKDKEEVIDTSVDKQKRKVKCRYNDRGYCRQLSECVFLHSDIICDKVLSNGKCSDSKECLLRHPKDCKHWMGDSRGCLRGDVCKYLHQSNKKGINLKVNKNYDDTKSETPNKRSKQEVFIEKPDDNNVLILKEAIAAKEEEIKRMEETKSKLSSEKEGLVEENKRFQRILKNMNEEIKRLKSQTH